MIISKPHAHLQTMEKTCAKFQKDRYKIVWGVALTRYPLSIHFHRLWGQEMTKFAKRKKWQKLMQGLYPNHIHIFWPWRKRVQSFKKIVIKLYVELRSQGTHCLFTQVKKWQFTKWEKWQKITTRISSYHDENTCKVSKWSVQNCKRNCAHKTPRVNVDGWTNGRTDGRTDERTDGNLHA